MVEYANVTMGGSSLDSEKPMFPISVLASILKIHQRTLRIYDEEQILVPKRSSKNRRLYSISDIEKGKFIQFLARDLGINLSGIKIILHLLEQLNIKQEEYQIYLEKVAESVNITQEMQEQNKIKLARRGRKPKLDK